jgi:hypothetical protein
LNLSLEAADRLPFPFVLGMFNHWADEPPLEQSLAALAGFKKQKPKMTAAEDDMLQANSKVIPISTLPPSVQNFFHTARTAGRKNKGKA